MRVYAARMTVLAIVSAALFILAVFFWMLAAFNRGGDWPPRAILGTLFLLAWILVNPNI